MKKKRVRLKPVKYVVVWIEVHSASGGKFYNRIGGVFSREATEEGQRDWLMGSIKCILMPEAETRSVKRPNLRARGVR